jgi:Transposase DDE domain group 1
MEAPFERMGKPRSTIVKPVHPLAFELTQECRVTIPSTLSRKCCATDRCSRRVVGKAEYLDKGENPRFVVTSLTAQQWPTQDLYEKFYCARGEMENRIKEQMCLFADRLSTDEMKGNQLRLYFSALAYTLMEALRRLGLKGTEWAQAQVDTIRLKLFKIGAIVRISIRRIVLVPALFPPHGRRAENRIDHLALRKASQFVVLLGGHQQRSAFVLHEEQQKLVSYDRIATLGSHPPGSEQLSCRRT